jgi:hypothetical protein
MYCDKVTELNRTELFLACYCTAAAAAATNITTYYYYY